MSDCSMPRMRFREVELLVSDCTIPMPSMIQAYEVDVDISSSSVKTSGQCDYTILEKSALLFFIIVPLLRSVEECLLVVPQPARSLGLSTGLRHDSWRLLGATKTIPGTTVSSIRSFHLGELSSYPQTSTPCISLEVPKKCFAGVSPNSSLTTALKITLFLSGIQFVECSASVDAL